MAQLTERFAHIPKDLGLKPAIHNFFKNNYLLLTVEKTNIKEKEAGNGKVLQYCT